MLFQINMPTQMMVGGLGFALVYLYTFCAGVMVLTSQSERGISSACVGLGFGPDEVGED